MGDDSLLVDLEERIFPEAVCEWQLIVAEIRFFVLINGYSMTNCVYTYILFLSEWFIGKFIFKGVNDHFFEG